MDSEYGTFDEIARAERARIGKGETDALVGLAFSGGGIRSATFNLGVIQGLARLRLLGCFDYLSTVSGGGYIGGWFSAWLDRHFKGDLGKLEDELNRPRQPGVEPEPPAIWWLRRYSNYLTPKRGLSGDTLAALANYLRNLIINLVPLVALASFLLLMPRLLLMGLLDLRQFVFPGFWLPAAGAAGLTAAFLCGWNLSRDFRQATPPRRKAPLTGIVPIVLTVALAAQILSFGLYALRVVPPGEALWPWMLGLYPAAWALAWGVAAWVQKRQRAAGVVPVEAPATAPDAQPQAAGRGMDRLFRFSAPFVSGALIGLILEGAAGLFPTIDAALWVAGYGPPLVLLIFWVGIVFQIGLAGRYLGSEQLEWWSRLGGLLLAMAGTWALLHTLLVYSAPLVEWAGAWAAAGGAVWIAKSAAGALLSKSATTGGKAARPWAEWVVRIAPWVFILGLFILLAWAWQQMLGRLSASTCCAGGYPVGVSWWEVSGQEISCFVGIQPLPLGVATFVTLAVAVIALYRLDVNLFSLHHFYRNRLTRCFLGASRYPNRRPHLLTGFDPADDLDLADLGRRPYPIVNTAINLVGGSNLAWQTRKAAAFFFTPDHCGYEFIHHDPKEKGFAGGEGRVSAFVRTARYDGGIRLGSVVAISGAAASPNMGYHSSPSVAFLMTVFNVRLGVWCTNPLRTEASAAPRAPRWGGLWLIDELLGRTDYRSRLVNLSDGGHFENLGVYELVRRRCRYIVAVDAGCDPKRSFDDLANLIRKCYTDFGAVIDLDLSALKKDEAGWSRAYAAVGTIDYGSAQEPGHVLYIKPGLLGNEPADILNYQAAHGDFPHEGTADQFFDEDQFEAYRKLGRSTVLRLFREAMDSMEPKMTGCDPERFGSLLETVRAAILDKGSRS